ncbi:MAG: ribonuclease P protein component 4 [Candidatus Thorarchaeota archaeon]
MGRRTSYSKRRSAKERTVEIARSRVGILWNRAQLEVDRPDVARRHIQSARRIAQRARIKIPSEMRVMICRKCNTLLVPGRTCRVRVRNNRSKHVTVTCLNCGTIRRFHLHRRDTSIA